VNKDYQYSEQTTCKYKTQPIVLVVTIFTRMWLRYVQVFAIANPSVVCNVHAPYWGGRKNLEMFLHHFVH